MVTIYKSKVELVHIWKWSISYGKNGLVINNIQVITEGFPSGLRFRLQTPCVLLQRKYKHNISSVILTIPNCVASCFYDNSYRHYIYISVFMPSRFFTFSVPSPMAVWMCIPGAFFPLLTKAATGFIFSWLINCLLLS